MRGEGTYVEGLHAVENPNKKLVYTKEVKDFVAANPNVLRTALELVQQVNQEFKSGARAEQEGVSVEMKSSWPSQPTYQVVVGDKTFFLKIRDNDENAEGQGGYDEVIDTHEAEGLFDGVKNIEITKYKLGFTDKNKKYYVSEWIDSPEILELDDFLAGGYVRKREAMEEYEYDSFSKEKEHVLTTVRTAVGILSQNGYWDIGKNNMVYDPLQKKVILFDLNKERGANAAN